MTALQIKAQNSNNQRREFHKGKKMSHSGRPDLHYSSALTSLVPLAKLFSLYFFICSVAGTIIPITKGFCEDFKR
jgi:hypothetical protein